MRNQSLKKLVVPIYNNHFSQPMLTLKILYLADNLSIPIQAATRICLKAPPEYDSFRHPIPKESAMGI